MSLILTASVFILVLSGAKARTDVDAIKAAIAEVESGWGRGDGTPFRKHFLNFDGRWFIPTRLPAMPSQKFKPNSKVSSAQPPRLAGATLLHSDGSP